MKILHVVEPFSSGIITFIIHITEELSDCDHFVLHGKRVSQDQVESVRNRFPESVEFQVWESAVRHISPVNDLKAILELKKTIKDIEPDVIHLHSSKAGFLGRFLGLFIKNKIIYTPNGASFLRTDVSRLKRWIFRKLEYLANKFSGEVVCCSHSEMRAFNSIGINSNYINNGININDIEKPELNKLIVATFALITAQKNPSAFNEIANYFEGDESIEFVWVGDGDRSVLSSSNIEITGWLNKQEVQRKYEAINVYLSTSLWEGLPFSVMEAMNAKNCLVLSKCVGNIDLVEHKNNGFLFNSSDQAINILSDLKNNLPLVRQMGLKSKELLQQRFDAKKNMMEYLEYYKR